MTARALITRLLLATVLLAPSFAWAQSPLLQGGQWSAGHVPAYSQSGGSQPIVQDGGAAGGGGPGVGLSELNITARCGSPPCASSGTGQSSAHVQLQDAPSTNATGYHFFAIDANSGGGGLVSYGAAGGAAALPLNFIVNGTTYQFPFTTGGVIGPGLSVMGHAACWNNLVGTLLSDCGVPAIVAGTPGQIQYNNAGVMGGFTVGGDGTLNTGTGALAVSKIGGVAATLGGALTTAGTLTTAGAFPITLTAAGATTLTLPQSGTLATLAGNEALTSKTVNGLTITSSTGTLSITNAKTASVANTLTFAGADGSTLNIGGGGTLGSAAFTSASAYVPSGSQIAAALGADVPLSNVANYFDGPSIPQGATGVWYACGSVTVSDPTATVVNFSVKLWDGTTVAASSQTVTQGSNQNGTATLCGAIASPAGNIRLSVKDSTSVNGLIKFNASGNSKDSSISAFRVQ